MFLWFALMICWRYSGALVYESCKCAQVMLLIATRIMQVSLNYLLVCYFMAYNSFISFKLQFHLQRNIIVCITKPMCCFLKNETKNYYLKCFQVKRLIWDCHYKSEVHWIHWYLFYDKRALFAICKYCNFMEIPFT